MNRRHFLTGLSAILASGVAPAVLPSGIIMPVRKLWTPPTRIIKTHEVWLDGYVYFITPNTIISTEVNKPNFWHVAYDKSF